MDASLALKIRTPKSEPPVEAGREATQPAKAKARISSTVPLDTFDHLETAILLFTILLLILWSVALEPDVHAFYATHEQKNSSATMILFTA